MLEGARPDDVLNESMLDMKHDPFTPLHPVYLGFQPWWLGRYDEALQAAQRSLEIDPDYPYGWYYVLGSAYAAKGNSEEAIIAHKKATELNPLNTKEKNTETENSELKETRMSLPLKPNL